MASPDPTPSASPPKKKKIFNFKQKATKKTPIPDAAPTSAQQDPADEEEDHLSLFKRSKEYFPKFAEQSQQRRKSKEGSVKRECKNVSQEPDARHEDDELHELPTADTPPSAKRRKLTPLEDEEDIYGVSDEEDRNLRLRKESPASPSASRVKATPPTMSAEVSATQPAAATPEARTRDKGKAPAVSYSLASTSSGSYHTAPIELSDDDDDDDDDLDPRPAGTTRRWNLLKGGDTAAPLKEEIAGRVDRSMTMPAEPAENEDNGDVGEADPFLDKYYQMALARKKEAAEAKESSTDPSAGPHTPGRGARRGPMPPAVPVIVECWIRDLRHLLKDKDRFVQFNIKMTQKLKVVRSHFIATLRKRCPNRPISDEEAESWILVFNGTKIYPDTTLETLQLNLDEDGYLRNGSIYSPESSSRGRVKFDCHVEQVFAKLQEERVKLQENGGELEDGSEDGLSDTNEAEEAAGDGRRDFRLTLKTMGKEPVKVTAHEDTTVERLIEIFRLQRGVPPEKTVTIHFDGLRLEEENTVADAEIEDEDVLDVHVD